MSDGYRDGLLGLADQLAAYRAEVDLIGRACQLPTVSVSRQAEWLASQALSSKITRASAGIAREMEAATRSAREFETATRPMRELRAMGASSKDLMASAASASRDIAYTTDRLGERLTATSGYHPIVDAIRDYQPIDRIQISQFSRFPDLWNQEFEFARRMDAAIRSASAQISWERLGCDLNRLTYELTASFFDLNLQPLRSELFFGLDTIPRFEVFAHLSLLGSLSVAGATAPATEEEEADESDLREEVDEGSRQTLARLLDERYPDHVHLWLGAQEGLTGTHDSVRHYCVSLRTLLEVLLRAAAPDAAVREWTSERKYFRSDDLRCPNWRGRIAYLCDRVGRRGYTYFVLTDVEAAFGVWDRLNAGVHKPRTSLSSRQVIDLQLRSNCLLLMALLLSTE